MNNRFSCCILQLNLEGDDILMTKAAKTTDRYNLNKNPPSKPHNINTDFRKGFNRHSI